MSRTFEAHTPLEALVLEPALLLARQLQKAADEAPAGHGLARAEAAAVPAARERARQAAQLALQTQATAVEKKGRRAAAVRTATSSPGTKDTPPATS
jgi:hypothetical protein